jgi:hypothetical protein
LGPIVPSGTFQRPPPVPAPAARPPNKLFRPPSDLNISQCSHQDFFDLPHPRPSLPPSPSGHSGWPRRHQPASPSPRVWHPRAWTPSACGRRVVDGAPMREHPAPGHDRPRPECADGEHLTRLLILPTELRDSYPPLGGYGVLFDKFGQCGFRLGWRAQNQGRVAIIKARAK